MIFFSIVRDLHIAKYRAKQTEILFYIYLIFLMHSKCVFLLFFVNSHLNTIN